MPDQIAVTRDMIEAGVDALSRTLEQHSDKRASDLVAAVYVAMERARRAPAGRSGLPDVRVRGELGFAVRTA